MSKEEALARLVDAIERGDITSPEANRRENSALQDAFNVLGVNSSGYWIMKGMLNDD